MHDSDPAIKLVQPREGRGRRKGDGLKTWQEAAPRWLLVAIVGVSVPWAVYQQNARYVALEEALRDADQKQMTRFLERLAVAEEQQRHFTVSLERVLVRMDKREASEQRQSEAIAELAHQIRQLIAQGKHAP